MSQKGRNRLSPKEKIARGIYDCYERNPILPKIKDKDGKHLCKWCYGPIPLGRRCWCSSTCVNEYELCTRRSKIKSYFRKHYKNICYVCNQYTKKYQIDHVIPVHLGGGLAGIQNLKPICIACHKIKTNKENSARRKKDN